MVYGCSVPAFPVKPFEKLIGNFEALSIILVIECFMLILSGFKQKLNCENTRLEPIVVSLKDMMKKLAQMILLAFS